MFCAGSLAVNAQVINGDFQQAGVGSCDAGATWSTSAGQMAPQYVLTGNNAWIDMTPCSSFGNGAYIEQQVATTPGQVYHVEMDIATCFGWQIWDTGFDIDINGSALNSGANRVFYNTFDNSVAGAMKWTTVHSSTFMATGSLTAVRITGNGANPQNPSYQQPAPGPGVMGLDNVSLKTGSPVTGLTENSKAGNNWALFPNPASNEFSLQNSNGSSAEGCTVTDLSGRVVICSAPGENKIAVGDLPAGIYLVLVNAANATPPLKLVISR